MHFLGKKGIVLFAGILAGTCMAGFGSGWLVGRQFPAHRFERFGETKYLLDATTGKVCDPFKDPKEDPFARYAVDPTTGKPVDPFAAYGGHAVTPPAPAYPPACSK
jgi:hypothetical protein